jgi:hypothetical protein
VTDLNSALSCTNAQCSASCSSGGTGAAGTGGTGTAGTGGTATNCQKGAAVFCYCAQVLGAGTCTSSIQTGANADCVSGSPADVAATVSCAGAYYISTTTPPNCTSFANACL